MLELCRIERGQPVQHGHLDLVGVDVADVEDQPDGPVDVLLP